MCKPLKEKKPPIACTCHLLEVIIFRKCRITDLNQSVIPAIVQFAPDALFPVPLRDHSRGALFALVALDSLRSYFSRWSHRPFRSHLTGCSHSSLVALDPIMSV